MKRALAVSAAVLLLAGCTGPGSNPAPGGSGGSTPLAVTELELRVLDAVHHRIAYCDPDQYPVAFGSPLKAAKRRLPTIRRDRAVYLAILRHEHIDPSHLGATALLRINTDYKEVQVIQMHSQAGGYRFDVVGSTIGSPSGSETVLAGTVSNDGQVHVQLSKPDTRLNCPICLARGVRIGTPTGPVPVSGVRIGMAVWSVNRAGRRIRATVLRTRHRTAPGELLRIQLADGRTVMVSPSHPTGDGRLVGQLADGDTLDGARIVSVAVVPYRGSTYDLLPSGPTGDYFADGVLLGSTLSR